MNKKIAVAVIVIGLAIMAYFTLLPAPPPASTPEAAAPATMETAAAGDMPATPETPAAPETPAVAEMPAAPAETAPPDAAEAPAAAPEAAPMDTAMATPPAESAAPPPPAAAAPPAGVVNVFNWSDYIDDANLEAFTRETGIKVVYDTFDSNDTLETKLLAGSTGYDIVVPTGTFLGRQIQAGVFQTLDKSKLPNIVHQDPAITARLAKYDPGNEYAVNYMWGTTGIGYNVAKVAAIMPDAPVDSWKLIFDPTILAKFKDCGIEVLDAPDEMIPAALNYLGKDPNSKDPAVIKLAEPVLKAIRPFITKFHSSQYINDLANGDICIAVGWSGDVIQAQSRAAEANNGVDVGYSIPKEGALIWFDNLAMPKDAPHPENALKFIDFMMRPDVAAKNTEYIAYASGSGDAKPLLPPEILENGAIYPSEDTLSHLYVVTPYDPKSQRVLNDIWTGVKAGL